jgi:hypothetical protein
MNGCRVQALEGSSLGNLLSKRGIRSVKGVVMILKPEETDWFTRGQHINGSIHIDDVPRRASGSYRCSACNVDISHPHLNLHQLHVSCVALDV